MKRRSGDITFGILLVIVGIIGVGNTADFWDVNIFFNGWWCCLIILASLVSMLNNGVRSSNTTWLFLGVLFYLLELRVLTFALMLPLILLVFGLVVLYNALATPSIGASQQTQYTQTNKDMHSYEGMHTKDVVCNGAFRNMTLDLRGAVIEESANVYVNVSFGSVVLLCDSDVSVIVKARSVFSTVYDSKATQEIQEKKIYLYCRSAFGTIKIK